MNLLAPDFQCKKNYSILNNKQTNTFVAMSIEQNTKVYSLSPHISNEYFVQAMQEVLHEDSEWTLASKDERTTLYTKLNNNNNGSEVSQRQEFKFVSHFPYNWRELFETIRDVTIRKEAAKQNLEQIKWIENHASERHDIVYVLTTTPNSWIVSQREMVTARAWQFFKDPNDGLEYVVLVERYVERDDVPVNENYVRAKVLFQVCLIKQSAANPENECDWTFITVMDIGGWVPQWIIDFLLTLAPGSIAKEMETGHAYYMQLKNKE
jgi:hypothetical protein